MGSIFSRLDSKLSSIGDKINSKVDGANEKLDKVGSWLKIGVDAAAQAGFSLPGYSTTPPTGSGNYQSGGTESSGSRASSSQFMNAQDVLKWFEPDQDYLWVVRFYDAPAPFNNYLPAIDIRMNLWALETLSKAGGNHTVLFPSENSPRTLSITQYDDQKLTLGQWHEAWVKKNIFPMLGCVAPLESTVRKVHVKKFTRDMKVTQEWKLLVFPTGSGDYAGNTGSAEARQIVYDYTIAGVFGDDGGSSVSGSGSGSGSGSFMSTTTLPTPNKTNPGQTPPINQAPPKAPPKSSFEASRF